jgi:hypothetical protein
LAPSRLERSSPRWLGALLPSPPKTCIERPAQRTAQLKAYKSLRCWREIIFGHAPIPMKIPKPINPPYAYQKENSPSIGKAEDRGLLDLHKFFLWYEASIPPLHQLGCCYVELYGLFYFQFYSRSSYWGGISYSIVITLSIL